MFPLKEDGRQGEDVHYSVSELTGYTNWSGLQVVRRATAWKIRNYCSKWTDIAMLPSFHIVGINGTNIFYTRYVKCKYTDMVSDGVKQRKCTYTLWMDDFPEGSKFYIMTSAAHSPSVLIGTEGEHKTCLLDKKFHFYAGAEKSSDDTKSQRFVGEMWIEPEDSMSAPMTNNVCIWRFTNHKKRSPEFMEYHTIMAWHEVDAPLDAIMPQYMGDGLYASIFDFPDANPKNFGKYDVIVHELLIPTLLNQKYCANSMKSAPIPLYTETLQLYQHCDIHHGRILIEVVQSKDKSDTMVPVEFTVNIRDECNSITKVGFGFMSNRTHAILEVTSSELACLSNLDNLTTSIWISPQYTGNHVPFSFMLHNELWLIEIMRYVLDLYQRHKNWFKHEEWFDKLFLCAKDVNILDLLALCGRTIFQPLDTSFTTFVVDFFNSMLMNEIKCDERNNETTMLFVTHTHFSNPEQSGYKLAMMTKDGILKWGEHDEDNNDMLYVYERTHNADGSEIMSDLEVYLPEYCTIYGAVKDDEFPVYVELDEHIVPRSVTPIVEVNHTYLYIPNGKQVFMTLGGKAVSNDSGLTLIAPSKYNLSFTKKGDGMSIPWIGNYVTLVLEKEASNNRYIIFEVVKLKQHGNRSPEPSLVILQTDASADDVETAEVIPMIQKGLGLEKLLTQSTGTYKLSSPPKIYELQFIEPVKPAKAESLPKSKKGK